MSAKTITITALSMAIICISTMFIQVPIPLGYAHLGNVFILLVSTIFGRRIGMISSGFGSALADLLTGFSMWILPTLIIKIIMGLIIASIAYNKNKPFKIFSIRVLIASILSVSWMVIGYTFSGAMLYGSIAAGIASAPGLIIEGIAAIIVFYLIGGIIEKSNVLSKIDI